MKESEYTEPPIMKVSVLSASWNAFVLTASASALPGLNDTYATYATSPPVYPSRKFGRNGISLCTVCVANGPPQRPVKGRVDGRRLMLMPGTWLAR